MMQREERGIVVSRDYPRHMDNMRDNDSAELWLLVHLVVVAVLLWAVIILARSIANYFNAKAKHVEEKNSSKKE